MSTAATQPRERLQPRVGDRLVIRGRRLGEPARDAEILAVVGPEGTPPFRVRWSDTGSETLIFPGSDAYVDRLAPIATTRALGGGDDDRSC